MVQRWRPARGGVRAEGRRDRRRGASCASPTSSPARPWRQTTVVAELGRWAGGDAGRLRSQDREEVPHSRKVSTATEVAGRCRAELGHTAAVRARRRPRSPLTIFALWFEWGGREECVARVGLELLFIWAGTRRQRLASLQRNVPPKKNKRKR